MSTKIYHSKLMNPLCEERGCAPEQASEHAWRWEKKRFHAHPSAAFLSWWNPYDTDPVSGASKGGHPDAYRKWARKDPGRWVHKRYGVNAIDAWNMARYLIEFHAWQEAGSPEADDGFISIAAPLSKQKEFWRELRPVLAQIGKVTPT